MEQYIKQFTNHTAYNAVKDLIDTPNVILCVLENEVHFNPYVPPIIDGHEYVKIGGIKWATMNVGANSITDTGLYFQWGDTQGYTASQANTDKMFKWANYKYGNGKSSPKDTDMTKYNSTDNKTVLDASDDAVTAAWGNNWRMPTITDFQALETATTSVWVTNYQGSGISGLLLTDKTDLSKTLFFPACGWCNTGGTNYVGDRARYWSSSLSTYIVRACNLRFEGSAMDLQDHNYRCVGFPVRGVAN